MTLALWLILSEARLLVFHSPEQRTICSQLDSPECYRSLLHKTSTLRGIDTQIKATIAFTMGSYSPPTSTRFQYEGLSQSSPPLTLLLLLLGFG